MDKGDQQLHKFALQLDDLRVGGDGGAGPCERSPVDCRVLPYDDAYKL